MRTFLLALGLVAPSAGPVRFAATDLGKVPAGWTAAKTGDGDGSVWQVTADNTVAGHVLTQTAAGPNKLFNLCVHDRTRFRDGELSVRVKPLAGKLDQGGGLVCPQCPVALRHAGGHDDSPVTSQGVRRWSSRKYASSCVRPTANG